MVNKPKDYSHLPGWSRLLNRELAAAYCGVSGSTFDLQIRPHLLLFRIDERGFRFDRYDVDRYIDRMIDGAPGYLDAQKALDSL